MKKTLAVVIALSLATPAFATGYYPVPVPKVVKVAPSGSGAPCLFWCIFGCAALLVTSAVAVNAFQNRPLRSAQWCGVGQ